MINWNNISLYKFQQIDGFNNRKDLSDLEKILFSTCVVFDLTEYELDKKGAKVASKLAAKVNTIFLKSFDPKPYTRIGKYAINYDPSTMTFGQYVELMFFLQSPIQNAHYVLASISSERSTDHKRKADYFHHQPITKITGSLKLFMERFAAFNAEYNTLFGLDEEVSGDAQNDFFNKRYGWIYSATQVAEHERITLDKAFELPVRQALNDLAFLKAKAKYEIEQSKIK